MDVWLLISNVLLLVVVLGLGAVVLSLGRKIGALDQRTAHLRLARNTPPVRIGEPLPPLVASSLEGQDVDLDRVAAGGTYVALLFVAADCPICRSVLPTYWRLMQDPNQDIVGYLASDGSQQRAYADYAAACGVHPGHFLVSPTLALQLRVRLLPYLVVIDPHGRLVAREAVQGPRALFRTLGRLNLAPAPVSASG